MAKNYLISYDLNSPGQKYQDVCAAIEKASTGVWCRPLESVYIIQSNKSAEDIYRNIAKSIDRNDLLLVIEVQGNYYWQLEQSVSDYLLKML